MAAPTYDNSARTISTGTGTSGSGSFTVGNNANRTLVALVTIGGGSTSFGDFACSYGGVSMVVDQFLNNGNSGGFSAYSFVLVNPATGSNTFAWTMGFSGRTINVVLYSFYNTDPTEPHKSDAQSSVSNATSTITTTLNNSVPISLFFSSNALSSLVGIPNNRVTFGNVATGWDNAISPAGNHTSSFTSSGGNNDNILIQVALAPFAVSFSILETITTTETKTAVRGAVFTQVETIATSENNTYAKGKIFTILETIVTADILTLLFKWLRQAKDATVFSNQSKDSSSWTPESKDSSSFTNQTKN